jgi:7,8-dihydro-6-hydroxymethylpterin-pyrophosphokinase
MSDSPRWSVAFVAVGSNIEPRENVTAALVTLKKTLRVRASSTFYRTGPIETGLGRLRTDDKSAPRRIDLDLVLYDDLVVNEAELTLPHPDIRRPFVHVPIMELLDSASGEMQPSLRAAIETLLPVDRPRNAPGVPLLDFTRELRGILG